MVMIMETLQLEDHMNQSCLMSKQRYKWNSELLRVKVPGDDGNGVGDSST